MRDQNLEIIKVTLAVVAPWSLELLVEVRVPLPLLRHGGGIVKGHKDETST